MASSSSLTSSIPKSFKYDVFISFGGEDTHKNFVAPLYDALSQKGIETYKDDEKIEKEEKISDELIRSIEDSRFYIIVFSKNYASSSWCLNELVKIMECSKMTEHTAYPVFYDVEPTEVRRQRGAVGEAFARHDNKEEAGKWREALKEAADLAGWELKSIANGHEAKFIQKIVEEISLELRFINSGIDENLVGMDSRLQDLVSSLEIGVNDVRMIGIKGMGGAGKTTLARAVFDRLSYQFEGASFVENVREVSRTSGLKKLQKQILSDVLNDEGITVSSVHEGKYIMKRMMRGWKILLVLDDVDQIEQLEALVGQPDWFKPGSIIIITTRDEQVLLTQRVNIIHDVKLLSNTEAIRLFSRYAFGREIPLQGYEELSRQIVDYAAGLPLTIRVLGSLLCGKDELQWKDTLARLKVISLRETLDKLELSYIGLEDDDYKAIFLDVACFMNGFLKIDAIRILESRGFHARVGLRVLEQKSLLTIPNGRLDMYRHIQEMGWNIVRREHPGDPSRHSRLWIKEEVKYILDNDLGTKDTRFLRWEPVELNPEIVMKGLGKMKRLQVLLLAEKDDKEEKDDNFLCSDWKFDKMKQYFPKTLRFLNWDGYPLWSLPPTFQAKDLISLEMYNSRIEQLWEEGEIKVLEKLRFLDLSNSTLTTLDLGMTPNLERLDLKKCHDLEKLHAPVGSLKRLVYLNLTDCSSFKSVSFIKQLESRNLFTFSKLDLIVKSSGGRPKYSPDNLQLLLFTCSYFEESSLPNGKPLKFVSLNLKRCTKLLSVSESICCLKHLRKLTINGCIPELPNDLSCLEYLENLSLKSTHIKRLPDSICMLKHLTSLELESCLHLEQLPANLGQLECLEKLSLVSTCITYLPDSICMLRSLKSLNLQLCELLKKLPEGLGQLGCLEKLILTKCKSLKDIPNSICNMIHLAYLHLSFCSLVEKLPEELGSLICLKELNVDRTAISQLPQCISLLKDLRIIGSVSVLQSCGSASAIQTSEGGTFFYIQQ